MTDKQLRGFALLSEEKRKECASKGGKAVPAEKRAFSTNNTLARWCGKIGGASVDPKNRTFYKDKEKAREAGRRGGLRLKQKEQQNAGTK